MNARIRKKMHNIIDLSFDAKDFGHDCFIQTEPHVTQLHICCYKGQWESCKEKALYESIKLDKDNTLEELDKIIEFLEKLIEESL